MRLPCSPSLLATYNACQTCEQSTALEDPQALADPGSRTDVRKTPPLPLLDPSTLDQTRSFRSPHVSREHSSGDSGGLYHLTSAWPWNSANTASARSIGYTLAPSRLRVRVGLRSYQRAVDVEPFVERSRSKRLPRPARNVAAANARGSFGRRTELYCLARAVFWGRPGRVVSLSLREV